MWASERLLLARSDREALQDVFFLEALGEFTYLDRGVEITGVAVIEVENYGVIADGEGKSEEVGLGELREERGGGKVVISLEIHDRFSVAR